MAAHMTRIEAKSGWRAHAATLYALGIPLVGAQMAQMALHATDIAMVGRLGAPELAATALAANHFFLVYMFGSGFLVAVSPIVAQAFGRGDARAVRRSTRMGLWFAAGYGVACIPALLAVEPLLLALGQQPELAAIAADYMAVAAFGMVPALAYTALRSFLGGINCAGILLWTSIAAVFVNAALNWVFIFGNLGAPAFGVAGAAIATVGTNIFIALVVAGYILRAAVPRPYEVFVRFWRPDWPVMGAVLKLGLPISLTIMAEVSMFQVASIFAGWLGVVPLAAHSIVMQLISFSFMVPLGLASAATIRVGQEIGAGLPADADRVAKAALMTGFAAAALTVMLFVSAPGALISIFLSADDPLLADTLAAAIPLLMIAAAFNLFDGAQAIAAGNLRGLKDTRVPMLIAIGAYWGIGIPLAWVFAFAAGLGAPGIWLGLAAGLLVTAVLLNWRFFVRLNALRAMPQPSPAS
jgi:multidrug resistance protein, MATE family